MMDTRMANVEADVKTIKEKIELQEAREARRGAILDKLIDEEVQRQELYKQIKRHVYGTGIVAAISMACAIMWFGIKSWLAHPAP